MNEDLFTAFLAVIDTGSFSAAARKINLTQPAISQRIKALEEQISSNLFERAPGRSAPKLTEAGRLVAEEARSSILRWESLKAEIYARKTLSQGKVTIGGGATAVSFLLPKVIADVLSRYPNLVIRVRESGSAEVVNRVLNRELDFGIITEHSMVTDPRLSSHTIREDQIVAVVANNHSLAGRHGSIHPKELSGERLVAYESSSAIGKVISEALSHHHVQAKVWTELRSIQSILEIARLTGSVALVSNLSESLWSGMTHLSCPLLENEMKRTLSLVWHNEVLPSVASKEFMSMLKGE